MTSLRFIELKTGYDDNGPAWIGRVQFSRSGRTLYFNGKAFRKAKGGGAGNHFASTGEKYWISGIKKNGRDRHWAGSGKITIEASAVEEYLNLVGAHQLDRTRFIVSHSIKATSPADFHAAENAEP
ncbi:MAG TPA: hypothetical protein VHY37_13950 [Tepidisphaeraceae bacterium]|jgi:hypothetical protein|nr:hypothetical protein [Tepidisphaeraceae bacterium]